MTTTTIKRQPKSYHDVKGSNARIVVCQGGTRSGKTYSILQALIEFCYFHRNYRLKIEIVRKTFTALRDTVMADFFEILVNEGIYQEGLHNRQLSTYNLYGNIIIFTGVDQAQKKRGSKRHILYVNEPDDLTWDEFFQLNVRCKIKTIMDYNPSMDEDHWIYTKVIPRPDCDFFITTYKDNPFLTKSEIHEIELLRDTDPYYWSVFGLGETTKNPSRVFTFREISQVPITDLSKGINVRLLGYGLDWGFTNDPTALMGIYERITKDPEGTILYKDIIIDEMIHRRGMTNHDISEELKAIGFSKHDLIYADSAEPKSIEELRRMGWRITGARKPRDGIQWAINYLKQHRIFITRRSSETQKEWRMFKYKQDRNGTILNEIVDAYDHTVDATRYCLVSVAYKGKYVLQ